MPNGGCCWGGGNVSFSFSTYPMLAGDVWSIGMRNSTQTTWTYCNNIIIGSGASTPCVISPYRTYAITNFTYVTNILTVSAISTAMNQNIVITGVDMGSLEFATPYLGNSALFMFRYVQLLYVVVLFALCGNIYLHY